MEKQEPVYWLSPLGNHDDFGSTYTGEMFDAKTIYGPWANMTRDSWEKHRASAKLGLGIGQRYLKQPDGKWLKVEG